MAEEGSRAGRQWGRCRQPSTDHILQRNGVSRAARLSTPRRSRVARFPVYLLHNHNDAVSRQKPSALPPTFRGRRLAPIRSLPNCLTAQLPHCLTALLATSN